MAKQPNVMPTGSPVPTNTLDPEAANTIAGQTGNNPDDVTNDNKVDLSGIPDKFIKDGQVDTAAMAKSYTELEGKYTEAAAEKGDVLKLRRQVDVLSSDLAQVADNAGADETAVEAEAINAQAKVAELQDAVAKGDISIEEAMGQVYALANDNAARVAEQRFKEGMTEFENRQNEKAFVDSNPFANEALQRGSEVNLAVGQIMNDNPMLNFAGAVQVFTERMQQATAAEEAEARVVAAKEEGVKIAKGADPGPVLKKSGTEMQTAAAAEAGKPKGEATAEGAVALVAGMRDAAQT